METQNKGLNLFALIALIVSSIIGGGIFNLMSDMANTASAGATLIGWLVAGVGMGSLAFCIQNLNAKRPDLDAGIYSYAREGFGNYMGFNSIWGYWVSVILGNVAFGTLMFSAIGYFIPIFEGGQNIYAIIGASVVLWLIHVLILKGIEKASFVNTIVTITKLVPLALFLVFVIFAFKSNIFTENFWGTLSRNFEFGNVIEQVKGTMLITVWVFIGIEGAVVFSSRAKKRSDVGKATIIGFATVTLIYMLVTVLSYGIMTQDELRNLPQPAMAYVLESVIGKAGAVIVNIGVIISILGAWISCTLLAEESGYQAAKNETFPKPFLKENKEGAPIVSLLVTNVIVQLFLFSFLFTDKAYTLMASLSSSMILIPYAFIAFYQVKYTFQTKGNADFMRNAILGIVSSLYMLWLLYASGVWYLLLTVLLFAPGTLIYIWVRKSYQKKVFTKIESVIAMIFAILFVVCIWQLVM
ncbi:arginine-ornithine antiporter [Isobaculum melis]|uniref:Arginine-ornithine antiporter n=1 Tax=Isobaculum melis TaxID=142588 RepID=A0A1H9PUY6_9LACT|nr:arginine-ornithine antiporter [Isobaculum melis]SER51645.1 arginine:ornithine antiporter / lysine permease [Isobaculum melis]